MIKNKFYITILLGLFFINIFSTIINNAPIENISLHKQKDTDIHPLNASPHAPILINNNISSFPDKTGLGTVDNPYIIQDLEISTYGSLSTYNSSLHIMNTNATLIIRNIIIENIIGSIRNFAVLRLFNCNNTKIENITIRNIYCSAPDIQFMFYFSYSNNITASNLYCSNLTLNSAYIIYAYQSANITISNCQNTKSIFNSDGTECGLSGVTNCLYDSAHVYDINTPGAYMIYNFIATNNILLSNSIFERIKTSNSMLLYMGMSSPKNLTIFNNVFRDLSCETMSSNVLVGESINLLNNQFVNIFANQDLQIFRLNGLIKSQISSNILKNLSSNLFQTRGILCMGTNTQNTFFNNTFLQFSSRDSEELCLELGTTSTNNRIYYNRFMTGSILADDDGGNIYKGLLFYPPMQTEMYVGNYWIDHHLDDSNMLHYIVNTPRTIDGNGNVSDLLPLHYYGMDYDDDGLINYYEIAYDWLVWDPDTDNDGILDGQEEPPTSTNFNSNTTIPSTPDSNSTNVTNSSTNPISNPYNWNELIKNPQTVALFAIVILLFFNLFRKPKFESVTKEKISDKNNINKLSPGDKKPDSEKKK